MDEQKEIHSVENKENQLSEELKEPVAQEEEDVKQEEYEEQEEDDDVEQEEESVELQGEPLMRYTYRIGREMFGKFEEYYSREMVAKDKRMKLILGLLQIVIGVLLIFQMATGKDGFNLLFTGIAVILIGFGIYYLLYHKYFYKKLKKKAIDRYYDRTPSLSTGITLVMYGNGCLEQGNNLEAKHLWRYTEGVHEFEDSFHIKIHDKRMILVPKPEDEEESEQLKGILKDVCQRYEKEWLTL